MTSWLVESLRLTVFTQPPEVDVAVNWWQTLAGAPPASHTVERLGPHLQQQGPILDNYCNLLLSYQPGRIDWVMTPIVPPTLKFEGFPNIGAFEVAVENFKGIFLKWIEDAPTFKRLAVGAVLVLPVRDKEEGYERIQPYLPSVKLDSKNSADFSYSINRPRISGHVEARINRLSKWSVAMLSGVRLEIGGPGQSRLVEAGEQLSACRLELDINTQPDRTDSFPSTLGKPLLDELLACELEIAKKGDIP